MLLSGLMRLEVSLERQFVAGDAIARGEVQGHCASARRIARTVRKQRRDRVIHDAKRNERAALAMRVFAGWQGRGQRPP